VATAPRSRGRATAGPLCGQAAASPRPRGGGTSKAGEQAAPIDVRVATTTHETRGSSERRHGRREMRRPPPNTEEFVLRSRVIGTWKLPLSVFIVHGLIIPKQQL
jgi:hypothetical protein